jgi:hypothetical protein
VESATRRRDFRAVDVVALGVVVLALFAAGIAVGRTSGAPASARPPGVSPRDFSPPGPPTDVRALFAGPDTRPLPPPDPGEPWDVVAGGWGIQGGSATVIGPSVGKASMIVTDLGSTDGTVTAAVGAVGPGMGLVVRASSPSDYWAALVDPYSRRWGLARFTGGTLTSLRTIGSRAARPGDTLTVEMTGDRVSLSSNRGPAISGTDPTLAGTRIGLIATFPGTPGSWRDLSAHPTAGSAATTTTTAPPVTGFAP